jgi:hypothetical protein
MLADLVGYWATFEFCDAGRSAIFSSTSRFVRLEADRGGPRID